MKEEFPSAAQPRWNWLIAGLLVLLSFASYGTVLKDGGWIWDDDQYVLGNLTVQESGRMSDIWFDETANPQYYPLVYSSFRLESILVKGDDFNLAQPELDATLFHFDNILIFALTVLLFWRVLQRLRIPGALIAAALFAVHPVNVESVAWVTERKNMFSGLFGMAVVLLFLRFARIGDEDDDGKPKDEIGDGSLGGGSWAQLRWGSFALAIVCWFAGLFSKTVIAFVPAALILLIWWKRPKWTLRLTATLIPFFIAGIYFGLRTARIEIDQVGASEAFFDMPFLEKCVLAGSVLWTYLMHVLAPIQQMFFYPKWDVDSASIIQWALTIAAVALPLTLLAMSKRLGRGPLVAILIFGGALVPVMGFFPVYPMRFSWVADHFQYHANFAIFALLGAILIKLPIPKKIGMGALGAVLVVFSLLSNQQGKAYAGKEQLWRHVIEVNPESWIAFENLSVELRSQGREDEALEMVNSALAIYRDPHTLLTASSGQLAFYFQTQDMKYLDQAQAYIEEALAQWPKQSQMLMRLGDIFYFRGAPYAQLCIETYEKALTRVIEDDYQAAFVLRKLQGPMAANMTKNWLERCQQEGDLHLSQGRSIEAMNHYVKSYRSFGEQGTQRWNQIYPWREGSPFFKLELSRIWMLTASKNNQVRNPQEALKQVKQLFEVTPILMGRGGVSNVRQRMAFLVLQDLHSVCLANTGAIEEALAMSQDIIARAQSQQAPPAFMDELRKRNSAIASRKGILFDFKVPIPPGY